jgi:hypothetical protein
MQSNHADQMDTQAVDQLESLIDKFGIHAVADCMIDICSAKAEHLQVNWQDEKSANRWRRRASMFTKLWADLVREDNPRKAHRIG